MVELVRGGTISYTKLFFLKNGLRTLKGQDGRFWLRQRFSVHGQRNSLKTINVDGEQSCVFKFIRLSVDVALHAPNRIAELSAYACKMRRLNQLNATYSNSMRVSRIYD